MTNKKDFDDNSIYGKFEMEYMVGIRKSKEKIFLPILKFLNKLKINANHVSFISALTTVVTFSLAIYFVQPLIFIIGIWIHMLLDGIDGALARYQKTASVKGTLVDVFGDQFGITLMCVFVVYFSLANIINISVFFVLYTIVIIFSFYFLYKKSRFEIVIRPRIFFYYAATIDVLIYLRFTDIIVLICNVLLLVSIIFGIYQIKMFKKK